MKPSIIVHGGAWNIPEQLEEPHVNGCEKAAALGYDLLSHGHSAIDAVEEAVASMEDDPTFDAGKGATLNQSGQVELDAIVMNGSNLRSGAVAAIRHVRNPIRIARKIMETTPFSMLAGEGALDFALKNGFDRCCEEDLLVGRELEDYKEFLKTGILRTREVFAGEQRDTVGACALDEEGHLACATSTGGIPRKIAGRVGDSPLVGAGAYADDTIGAASTTGWGEKIMAVLLAKTTIDLLKNTDTTFGACEQAIEILRKRVDGFGGVILLDRTGVVGYSHNTPKMAYAFVEGPSGNKGASVRMDR
jgi:beta-aspartyl-peptidase (threonine type)